MKICMITLEDARDKKTWSGTSLRLIECFEKDKVVVENLAYVNRIKTFGLGKLKKLVGFLMYQTENIRDDFGGWFSINSKFFKKNLEKYDVDAYLFMGEHCLKEPINNSAKSYVYLDRFIGKIVEYDENKRIGKRLYLKGYEKNDALSLNQMQHIFTLNDWSRDEIINKYHISENKVTNVGVGVNLVGYYGPKDYNNHKLLIVLRKGTEHYKGLDLLLEAFCIAKNKISDLTLHVVGTDYEKVDGVTYYYNQSREVTVKLFQECSLYVMPALLEPNGTTYLEALACKTPIIGLDRFAFPEFSGYGKYGFIVKNARAEEVSEIIIEAFTDTKKLEQMGIEGQQHVLNQYTWENVEKKMLEIMKSHSGED